MSKFITYDEYIKVYPNETLRTFGYISYKQFVELVVDLEYADKIKEMELKMDDGKTLFVQGGVFETNMNPIKYDKNIPLSYVKIVIFINDKCYHRKIWQLPERMYDIKSAGFPNRTYRFIKDFGYKKIGRPSTKLREEPKPVGRPIEKEPVIKKPNGRPPVMESVELQKIRTKFLKKILDYKKKHNLLLPDKQDYINKTNDELEELFNSIKLNLCV